MIIQTSPTYRSMRRSRSIHVAAKQYTTCRTSIGQYTGTCQPDLTLCPAKTLISKVPHKNLVDMEWVAHSQLSNIHVSWVLPGTAKPECTCHDHKGSVRVSEPIPFTNITNHQLLGITNRNVQRALPGIMKCVSLGLPEATPTSKEFDSNLIQILLLGVGTPRDAPNPSASASSKALLNFTACCVALWRATLNAHGKKAPRPSQQKQGKKSKEGVQWEEKETRSK